ncbi:hypothetical protein StoSoilB5_11160 [Arthrobacter sp. StoSoilB5]|nr:hypothetical protein StoSoilB5_11160 [Arthrobacter sp. StoSoilB5]
MAKAAGGVAAGEPVDEADADPVGAPEVADEFDGGAFGSAVAVQPESNRTATAAAAVK